MKRFLPVSLLVLGLIAGGVWAYVSFKGSRAKATVTYEFAPVARGDVQDFVSATGTLNARKEVEVGTQVSGTIDKVLVDFNDQVESGQLIALLDTQTLDAQVKTARADLTRAEAQRDQAKLDLERKEQIYEKKFLSEGEYLPFVTAKKTAEASVLSAEAALDRAITNRNYAEIHSPISGIVIDRVVDPGQTVAASFNTPRLFTIAESLETMEILTNVDESDIGRIQSGQAVKFTVASYPEESFHGTVDEIRLMPKVISNVVNYTVVVLTENPGRKLLPGMTATAEFVVAQAKGVLTVPAAALTLRLTDEMRTILEASRADIPGAKGPASSSTGGNGTGPVRRSGGNPGGPGKPGGGRSGGRSISYVWRQDGQGKLSPIAVKVGVNDGVTAEIAPLGDARLAEGDQVISRVNTPAGSPAPVSPPSGSSGGPRMGGPRLF